MGNSYSDTACIIPYRKFLEFAYGNFREVLNIPEKYKAPITSVKLESCGHTREIWNELKCTLSNKEVFTVSLMPPGFDGGDFHANVIFGNIDSDEREQISEIKFHYMIDAKSYMYTIDSVSSYHGSPVDLKNFLL